MKASTGREMIRKGISELLPRQNVRGHASRKGAWYTSGKLWPHGEWSYGYARSEGDGGDWHEEPIQVSAKAEERLTEGGTWGFVPLDLSAVSNSHTPARRGKKGMTGYGQQMIKAAGHLMEHLYPHHPKTLGTITLPTMSREARVEVVAAWPEIVRQLLQWQCRKLKRLGLPQALLSVSEIQPKRLVESGEACLHLHQLWLNSPVGQGRWTFSPNEIRAYVDKLLRRVSPSYAGGFVNVDTKPVEGTVAAYMAKYMSKGRQQVAEALEDWGEDNCPRTWWNMSKPMRDAVKARILKGPAVGAKLEETLELAFQYGTEECYAFLSPIMIEFGEEKRLMGWRGRFLPDLDRTIRCVLASSDN